MREAASQILLDRARESDGLRRTVGISLGGHVVICLAVLLSPNSWLSGNEGNASPDVVMSISLGGPRGPGEGRADAPGWAPGARDLPLVEARRPQWIQPPTPIPPKMTVPVEEPAPRPEVQTEVETAPDEARGRTPTRGPELLDGTAMADTGVEGIGVGLSTGGLGGSGAELNVGDFCCPEYLATMAELIRRQWNPNQEVPGTSIVRFTVQRNGTIDDVVVDRGSGYFALDMSAQRAVLMTGELPPLPSAYTQNNLTVRLRFEYRR